MGGKEREREREREIMTKGSGSYVMVRMSVCASSILIPKYLNTEQIPNALTP